MFAKINTEHILWIVVGSDIDMSDVAPPAQPARPTAPARPGPSARPAPPTRPTLLPDTSLPPLPPPPAEPAPLSDNLLTARLEYLERHVYNHSRWVENMIRTTNNHLERLSERVEAIEDYFGLQDAQPVYLYCGERGEVHNVGGDPNWRQHLQHGADDAVIDHGEADNIEAHNAATDNVEVDDAQADNVQTDNIEAQNAEAHKAATDNVQVDNPKADHIQADGVQANPIQADGVQADHIQADGVQAVHVQVDIVMADNTDVVEQRPVPDMAPVPRVHVVPATPQAPEASTMPMAPPLPALLPADADTTESASQIPPAELRRSRRLLSPEPAYPPPPRPEPLCRSPRRLSPAPSNLVSRGDTPQPNKKRAGTSEDRDDVKRGRKA